MDDDIVDILAIQPSLSIGMKSIEDEKTAMVLAAHVAYASKQRLHEIQAILHSFATGIEANRKMTLLVLQVLPAKVLILNVRVGVVPVV